MPNRAVFDTRFFIEYFYTSDQNFLKKLTGIILQTKEKIIATVTVYEVYRLILSREGRDIAKIRVDVILRDFKVENLTPEIAIKAAEINNRLRIPLADSVIAATAQNYNASVVTDDPHFLEVKDLKINWLKV